MSDIDESPDQPLRPAEGQLIPTGITTTPTSIVLGNACTVTINFNENATADTAISVGTDHTSLFAPPTGNSSWPATVTLLNGHSSLSFTLQSQGSTPATAHLGTCAPGCNAGNSSNWTVSCSITVTGQTPP